MKKNKFMQMLAVFLSVILTVQMMGLSASAAEESYFDDISVTIQKDTPTSASDVSVYTVTISFTLVNQVSSSEYVRGFFEPLDVTDDDGRWLGTSGIGRVYVNKSEGGKGTITINDVPPGKYYLDLIARTGARYINEEQVYTLDKLEQPDLTLKDPNGILNNLTYGDSINSLGMGVQAFNYAIYVNEIKSDNEDVVRIEGSSNSIHSMDIVSAGTFNIVATTGSHTYYKVKQDVIGPFTVNKKPLNVEIDVNNKQYDGTNNASFEAELVSGGVINNDDVTLVYDDVKAYFDSSAVGTDIPVTFTGDFSLTGEDADNYTLVIPSQQITADIYNGYTAQKGVDYTVNSNEWINEDFVVTAQPRYSLSLTDTADGSWTDELSVGEETADGILEFYVKNNSTGAISLKASESYKIDKTAPTGKIGIGGIFRQELADEIAFSLFFNGTQILSVEAEDALSGVAKREYICSDKALSIEEL